MGERPGEDGAPDAVWPDGALPDVSFWIREEPDAVDLLLLVDDSNSMREEQAALVDAFPDFLGALQGVGSLHVGVISTDMGTDGYPVTTCDDAQKGLDGRLQHEPSYVVEGCDLEYPLFLGYDFDAPDPGIDDDFRCVATLGTGGCGFERQLDAIEKALTVHEAPGGADEGFLRVDALLAIGILTDENDCSVGDPTIFGDDDSLGPLDLRCYNNPELQRPVAELVESVHAVKPDPDRLVVAGILGVPADLAVTGATPEEFDAILADPRLQEVVDYTPEGGGNRLVPSCDIDGLGIAFSPVRILEWMRGLDALGNDVILQSLCQFDFSEPMTSFADLVERHVHGGNCTSSPVAESSGPLRCALYETRWDGSPCGSAAIDRGTPGGARVCEICQREEGDTDAFGFDVSACPGDAGWRYVPDAPACPRGGLVDFTSGSEPAPTSSTWLACRWPAG